MQAFQFQNPTKLIFGTGQVAKLREELAPYQRILLVYGSGSIMRNGLYDQVTAILADMNLHVIELAGVEPNPRLHTVHEGVKLCLEHDIDFILAVGGGSVIDCVKAIAAGAKYEGDAWDFLTRRAIPKAALPIGTILTIAATGSEMNGSSVITNWETKEKLGFGSPLVYPKFSILDATYTKTLPKDQTVYGMIDIMSHVFENYFHHDADTPIQDGWMETLLKTVIETSPKLVEDLENTKLRETILLSGTLALNGMTTMGVRGDWATHNIEHAVSAVYDIPHGGGLAILFPNWMKHVLKENPARFKQLAVHVFGINAEGLTDEEAGLAGIEAVRAFWNSIGAPSRLADYDIDDTKLEEMADKCLKFGPFGGFKKLEREDVLTIYRASL
ncbi:iron-containing alcohol dehydrogenase [Paenibacillus sp. 1001270B_150601_E10]|uniref:iron-containing alcohol dehydrogenase n=1 Tax=Paenibacillus sp. 1001270B_150601_E10 TaxID=2787079 RepID=UPI00189E289E|nr:iron-containing alcohol dehydrogenase [Paenibacillus sp. 1001270B_150601_E10]